MNTYAVIRRIVGKLAKKHGVQCPKAVEDALFDAYEAGYNRGYARGLRQTPPKPKPKPPTIEGKAWVHEAKPDDPVLEIDGRGGVGINVPMRRVTRFEGTWGKPKELKEDDDG